MLGVKFSAHTGVDSLAAVKTNRSLPRPPVSVSVSAPPTSTSSSAPPLPYSRSLPPLPLSVSAALVEVMISALAPLFRGERKSRPNR